MSKNQRKERKTFTLSRQSIALLDDLRAARRGRVRRSASAVLDDVLLALRKERRRASIERAVAQYYSDLSDAERASEAEWGDFALAQLSERDW